MTNNFLSFWPRHYTYIEAISPITLSPPSSPTEIAAVRIEEAITAQKMIKRSSKENRTDFLQIPDKLFSKKRRQVNKSK